MRLRAYLIINEKGIKVRGREVFFKRSFKKHPLRVQKASFYFCKKP